MNYDTLHRLIEHLETFEQETGRSDLLAFSRWLQQKCRENELASDAVPRFNRYGDYNGQIAHAVGVLYQHARHYIKTALKDLPLNGLHDFTSLAALLEQGDQRKSDLIAMNMLEFSPAMEVIRRLLRRGLIEDYDDPDDARSKRVRITERGRTVFQAAMGRMIEATRIVGGNLSEEEKQQLLVITGKLLHFHRAIWENDLGTPLVAIREKYLE